MDGESPFGMLIFFAIFEVLGGAALGVALRGILRRDFTGLFFLIWGAGFGGIPLFIGAATFLSTDAPMYFYAQLFLFLTAIVTVALLPNDFMQSRGEGSAGEGGAIMGALMTMLGGAVVVLNLREGLSIGIIIGAFFAIVGLYILLRTAFGIVRS